MTLLEHVQRLFRVSRPDDDFTRMAVACEITADGIGVRLREFKHPCGHTGFLAEFYLRERPDRPMALLNEPAMDELEGVLKQCLAYAELRHNEER